MGRLEQTADMKTTWIFLAFLLVMAGASMEKCNKKTEAIAAQDCKKHCNVAKRGKDCAMCIWNHHDPACQGNTMEKQCSKTVVDILEGDCKKKCELDEPGNYDHCDACVISHKDLGLACWTGTGCPRKRLGPLKLNIEFKNLAYSSHT